MDWDAWMTEVDARESGVRAADQCVRRRHRRIQFRLGGDERRGERARLLGQRTKVVVTEAEFPTIGHVWLAQERRGARVSWVPVRDGDDRPGRLRRA